jgi:hypothetical protein
MQLSSIYSENYATWTMLQCCHELQLRRGAIHAYVATQTDTRYSNLPVAYVRWFRDPTYRKCVLLAGTLFCGLVTRASQRRPENVSQAAHTFAQILSALPRARDPPHQL